MTKELKPCPFCGNSSVTVREGSTFRWILAECNCCGATSGETRRDTMKPADAEEDSRRALEKWNLRAQDQAEAGQWILVGERLPDIDGRLWAVLTDKVNNGEVTGYYPLYEYYHFDNGWATDEKITHWLDVKVPSLPSPRATAEQNPGGSQPVDGEHVMQWIASAARETPRTLRVDPELLTYWKTLPAPSNERLAVDLIESLQRELAEANRRLEEAEKDALRMNWWGGDVRNAIDRAMSEGKPARSYTDRAGMSTADVSLKVSRGTNER